MRSGMMALRRFSAAILLLTCQGPVFAALAGDVAVNQWFEFSNSKMESAFPGTGAVMVAWSGGVYDSGRDQLVIWGGGHADYSGNEVYAFGPLAGTNPTWKRLTNPSNPPADNKPYAPDGRPVSRHTMAVLDYLPTPFNKMISCGIPSQYSNGYSASGVDLFDFTINGMTGQPWSVGAAAPSTEYASMAACAYNPATQRVWFQDAGSSRSRLQQYNPTTNTWTAHAYNSPVGTTIAAIDPTRNLFVWLEAGVGLKVFDLNNPDAPPYVPATSGVANPQTAYAPGFVYDPVNDRFVAWHGGTTLYSLSIPSNPKTGTWTWAVIPLDGGNTVTPSVPTTSSGGYETGTYGRFRYLPALHGVVVVSATDQSVYFRKLDGTVGSPVPSVTLSATPTTVASGRSSTLTWTTANMPSTVTGCTASGSWSGTKTISGFETTGPLTATATYTLTCGSAVQGVTITIGSSAPPAVPTATISATSISVTSGGSSTLTWSSTNATSCTASNAWTRTNLPSSNAGTPVTPPTTPGTYTYSLTCTGLGGTSPLASVTVAVTAAAPAPAPVGAITTVQLQNTIATAQTNAVVTFGHAFKQGDVPTRNTVIAKDSLGNPVTLQVDKKATYADGTLRHAVLTAKLPTLAGSATIPITLFAQVDAVAPTLVSLASLLLDPTFDSQVSLNVYNFKSVGSITNSGTTATATITGHGWATGQSVTIESANQAAYNGTFAVTVVDANTVTYTMSSVPAGPATGIITARYGNPVLYTASARTLLQTTTPKPWLSGPEVSEWIVGGPVKDASGVPHPHLTAYFHIRAYAGSPITKVRVDAVVENNWTFKAGATAFLYLPTVTVGGTTIYNNGGASLTQYHHTRWHQIGWWNNSDPQIFVQHNTRYLRDTKAVPNYASITLQESVLSSYSQSITPMSIANMLFYWPDTGYSSQIGMMPEWYASYIISGDIRAYNGVLANDSAGGSYSYHYRDENTGLVPSIDTYPTLSEQYPETGLVAGAGGNPNTHDTSHSPLIGYLGYMLTGDYYYLEELQFLANYNFLYNNYVYRQYDKGVLSGQNRAMAWGIRTIAAAAAITPDSSPLQSYFVNKLNNNLDDKAVKWSLPPTNNLGAIQDYNWNPPSSIYYSPWQNNFFVATVNWTVELGFNSVNALSLRNWFNKWPTGLMGQDNSGFCPYFAGEYNFTAGIVDASNNYRSFLSLYQAQYPVESANPCPTSGLMNGYSNLPNGYYSNMQPALAMAVDAGTATQATWNKFVSLGTADYTGAPVWGIVPRPASGSPASPSVTLTANPSSVVSGRGTSLTWVALNSSGCTAAWTASQATSDNQSILNITSTTAYSMTCTGTGGSTTQSVTVTVTVAPPPPVPTVTLSASSNSILYNTSSTLNWTSTNATSCTASGATAGGMWSGSQSTASSASKPLTNLKTTGTYTLTCSNASGASTPKSVTITVAAPLVPTVVTFTASPASLAYNTEGSTLTWSSSDATSCDAGGAWSGAKSASGSQGTGSLTSTSIFSITCTGDGGTSLPKSVTVTVAPPPTPIPTVTITANALSISSGNNVTLTWSSTDATACTASNAWSGPKLKADYEIRSGLVVGANTFTLTCTGAGATGSQSVTVNVTPPLVPTASINVDQSSVSYNGSTKLSWSSTAASKCDASGGWNGVQAVSGSVTFTDLKANTTYSIVCTGPGGSSATQQVTVAVAAPGVPTITLSATPISDSGNLTSTTGSSSLTVSPNDSVTLTWSSANTDSCTALASTAGGFEGWSGTQSTSGTRVVGPLTLSVSLTLDCVGPVGKDRQTVAITVTGSSASQTTKVGGGVMDPLMAGGLLLLWAGLRRARAVRISYRG